jgi:hypothetical protein
MDMQQMMQQLQARMGAWGKEMNANQETAEANAKANQEDLLARMEEMDAKMDANQSKATKQEEMLAEISTSRDTKLNEIREEITSGQAEMRSVFDEWLMDLKDGGKRRPPAKKRRTLSPIHE